MHHSASLEDGDPLLEFETEESDPVDEPREVSVGREFDPLVESSEPASKAPTFTVEPSFEAYEPTVEPEVWTIAHDPRPTPPRASIPGLRALTPSLRALTPRLRALTPDLRARTPDLRALAPGLRALTPHLRAVTANVRRLGAELGPWTAKLRVRTLEIQSTASAWLKEASHRAAITGRRYGVITWLWILHGCKASYRLAGVFAGRLHARGDVIWARVRTVPRPSFFQGASRHPHTDTSTAPVSVALQDAAHKIAAWTAAVVLPRCRSAGQTAMRLAEIAFARARTMRRDIPVPFALAACATVGTVMFLLGRLSVVPAPAKPPEVTPAAVTSFERAAAARPDGQIAAASVPTLAAEPTLQPVALPPRPVATTPAPSKSTTPAPSKSTTPAPRVVTPAVRAAATPAARAAAPPSARGATPPVTSQSRAAQVTRPAAPRTPTVRSTPPPRPAAAAPSRSEAPAAASPATGSPFHGSLAVSSSPPGAQVFVNGVAAGTTPLLIGNLPVGSRAVRVVLDGYEPWSSTVQIVTDKRTATAADLNPLGGQ